MATIVKEANGRRRVEFRTQAGKRAKVRLGAMNARDATQVRTMVEALVHALSVGSTPPPEVAKWVAGLSSELRKRFVKTGIVAPDALSMAVTLKTLMDEFFGNLLVKPRTRVTYDQTRRELIAHFGGGRTLRSIGPLEAAKWRQYLVGKKNATSTVSRRVKTARQMFAMAVEWGMLERNPFAKVKTGAQTNKARQHYVSREVATEVLKACPDGEWRLIVALSRFGGLRVPSETTTLRWADVDWAKGRILVRSPKTEHLEGKATRLMPLFPELRPYLLERFEAAAPGSVFVLGRLRGKEKNLRTQLIRIIWRAGQTQWPKLWHNMRSTRQTELAREWPAHVVSAWLGNTVKVAQDHYLQVTQMDFDVASGAAEAARIPARQPAETTGIDRNGDIPLNGATSLYSDGCREMPVDAKSLDDPNGVGTRIGFADESKVLKMGGAKSGATPNPTSRSRRIFKRQQGLARAFARATSRPSARPTAPAAKGVALA